MIGDKDQLDTSVSSKVLLVWNSFLFECESLRSCRESI